MSLNSAQRDAVAYCDGPLLVLAGAGSGKTRVITEKIAHLLRSGHRPEAVAAITFTNKAAKEMRERVGKLISREASESLQVSTFHALGLRILQQEAAHVGLRHGFSILDADDAFALVKDLAPAGMKPDALDLLRGLIGKAKDNGLDADEALAAARSPRELQAAELYAAYTRRLRNFNALDFDDLIFLPERLFTVNEDVRRRWQQKLSYLLVDEYQDTNRAQYRLLKHLVGERGGFTAVGDDDQSIYAWRGANPENLNELARDYPQLKLVKLEQNYRCSGHILRAANAVIANNTHLFEKNLWSAHGDGEPLRILQCKDQTHEAERIAAEIAHLQQTRKSPWSDFAILYRGNFQSRPFEQALRLLRVPYHVSGGTAFFDRAEVRDLLAYLRVLVNPDDDSAFLRIVQTPKRDIGTGTLEKLAQIAGVRGLSMARAAESLEVQKQLAARPAAALAKFAEQIRRWRVSAGSLDAAALCEKLIVESGYAQHLEATLKDPATRARRMENLKDLIDFLKAHGKGRDALGDLAAQLALLGNLERDDSGNAVRLSTLHASKGLEFRHVWLVGLEDGTLPHEGAINEGRLDEERRLFYVAITRAKDTLTLSHAAHKQRYGELLAQKPSRFLDELPAEVVVREGDDPERDRAEKRERAGAHLARLAEMLGGTD
ncbi:MAG: UvrD-helicase domain-containing protein [Rhodanobacteraceae bacterium]|nr:UvrD-helicase domain-containing protein [Rhodanobacteraceae bacterium]